MKDYFGNEIHIGDTILFSGRNSRGYRASFDECIVTQFNVLYWMPIPKLPEQEDNDD